MSVTFHLECDTCKESIWIGQRSHGRQYLYFSEEKTMNALEKFLYRHGEGSLESLSKEHELHFRSSSSSRVMDGWDDWSEVNV